MNLGEHIYQLRTARGLSQEDLAQALEVSRQSVSKWENNSAVPELDKLVKLSQLFGLTLDELVTGDAPPPQPEPQPVIAVPARYPNRIAGWILLVGGFVILCLLSLLGGFWTGLLFSSPLILPGIICLTVKKRVGLACAWAEFILICEYLLTVTGTSIFTVRNAILLAIKYADQYSAVINPMSTILS